MDNAAIARRFHRLAALMEIRGDDPFRLRSYRNAAEAIEVWPTPLKEIAEKEGAEGLQTIPGVGKAIAGKVIDLLSKGTFDAWERLTAETPETVLDLTEIPGIGCRNSKPSWKAAGWRWSTGLDSKLRKKLKRHSIYIDLRPVF